MGANTPVAVDDGLLRVVVQGALDLFLEDVGDALDGRRHHLVTPPAGTMLYVPAGAVPAGWRLVGLGLPDTEIVELAAPPDDPGELLAVLAAGSAAPDGAGVSRRATWRDALDRRIAALARDVDREGRRLRRAPREQRDRLRDVLDGLRGVVDGTRPDAAHGGAEQLELTLDALDRHLDDAPDGAGAARGAPGETGGRAGVLDADAVIARIRARGRRWRVVSLDPQWWRRSGAPMLGTADGGRVPVALLPRREGYDVLDPSTGRTARVDREAAARIAPVALVVHPRLPDHVWAGTLLRAALRRTRGDLVRVAAWGVLAGLVTLVTPAAVALVFDSVLPARSPSLLAAVAALLVGAAAVWAAVAVVRGVAGVRLTARLSDLLDPALTDRWLRLPSEFFRRYDTGDLAARAAGLQVLRQQIAGGGLDALVVVLSSLVNLVVLYVYSPELGLGATVLVAVAAVVLLRLTRRVVAHQSASYTVAGELSSLLFQSLAAIDKVQVAGATDRVTERWARGFRRQEQHVLAAGRLQALVSALVVAGPAVLALLLYAVTAATLVGRISAGEFLAVSAAVGQFAGALAASASTLTPLLSVLPLWQRLRPLLAEPVEPVGSEPPGVLGGRISLRAVSFRYRGSGATSGTARPSASWDPPTPDDATAPPEPPPEGDERGRGPVLDGVDLDIAPGEFVAVTGPSGSGKSTLLRLVLGLERPDTGVVRYDGTDLTALDQAEVRRQIGVVVQGARPMPGSILTTVLGTSRGEDGEQRAWAALEAASLADDVRRMPMGLRTVVGEGGTTFSGGQVQRLMIARALARRPRIVVLDEATSALDDLTQARVSAHLDGLDVTRVVVAHRLSTIRHADRIVVLDAGRIVQTGTYDELVAVDGVFRHLVERQSTDALPTLTAPAPEDRR
ncbi:ATP-binding cassette domain-containing protein [Actinomycetospora cinnamomea]|uniref:ABC-type bacteriocin/lantibiotic exporter with double-glycine peptidase domain n=1 Tax=Actinomycetospora cinnamomea TaxID=663609 RepID=A0A2U1FQV3_9PSEU|nr:ATP-binding cassette domain-containing protein [Actinomycetospora cinnamomea]PVZ14565.1 ABC-type bacteriocin/lantibiotic exporter with double-glycine peptidase domain [Actinomycetospora cinnamomea]